jgi:hypothetical protein
MISLCQEGKSSPDALRRSACTNSFLSVGACVGLSAVVPIQDRTRLPFALSALTGVLLPVSKLIEREHRELALRGPVALTARPGRPHAEEIVRCSPPHVLRSGLVLPFPYQEVFLPAIDGNQVGHELARYG